MKNIMKPIQLIAIMLFMIPGLIHPRVVTAQVCEYNYASGIVQGRSYVGGLAGRNASPEGKITNSYSRGQVTGETHVGGLAGSCSGTIVNSYSAGIVTGNANTGGLAGSGIAAVSSSYWDTQTSLQPTSAGGAGRSSDDMIFPYGSGTFTGWDFTNIWRADAVPFQNGGYPLLKSTKVYQVSVQVYPPGAGSVSGEGIYMSGRQAELTAAAGETYTFKEWSSGNKILSKQKQYTLPVTADIRLVARFESKATPVQHGLPLIESELKVYPNPVNDILRIDFSFTERVTRISIVNILGQTVKQLNILQYSPGQFSLGVADLKPGLYLIKAGYDKGYKSAKFVKF